MGVCKLTITFYNFANADIMVDKSAALVGGTVLTGEQIDAVQDFIDPTIIIQYNVAPTFNYCHIPAFGRYYFVTRVTWIGGKAYELQMHVDVLNSYKTKIKALSATAIFSASGNPNNYDPRLNFEDIPAVSSTTLNVTDNIFYVLRYWSMGGFSNRMSAAFMDAASFACFYEVYNDLSEAERVIAGTSIIDVTEVHYLNATGVRSLNQRTSIFFRNAAKSTEVEVDIADAQSYATGNMVYHIDGVNDVARLGYMDFETPATWIDGYNWTGAAKWQILLPYAGSVELTPAETGAATITYTALRVAYEPFENAYVITLFVNDHLFMQSQQTVPLLTSFAFPIDSSFDNVSGNRVASYLSMAATAGQGLGNLAMGNVLGAISTVSGIAQGINNLKTLDVRAGTNGVRFVGTTGGSPAYTATLDGTKIYWLSTTRVPEAGYLALWAAHGKPDGAYRALASLSGFAQFDNIILVGFDTATQTERNEIENYLRTGVIL